MSVLIKGMDMPKSCERCIITAKGEYAKYCVITGFSCINNERQKDCPLAEVPFADVVEVVRCKDCFHGYKTSYSSELRICLTTGCVHSENHFCSDGKRMDGGT